MSRLKRIILGLAVLLPILSFSSVLAVESTTDNSSQSTTTTEEPNNDPTARQQRLEKIKAEMKLKLDATEQKRLQERCKPAQAKIKTLGDNVNANVPHRFSAFDELDSHLNQIVTKLQAAGLDTVTLEAQQKVLDGKIATFKADLATYRQDLADLNNMGCIQDPPAFKSALVAARQSRLKLAQELADMAAYIKDTIKPTLVDLRHHSQQDCNHNRYNNSRHRFRVLSFR